MRINAAITEVLMGLGDLTINQMLVLTVVRKYGKVQSHVLAEELEGELDLIQVNKILLELEEVNMVKRRESLKLGTVWYAA